MRYLVTGGAGFIGSHLVDYLVNQNDQVFVIDNLSSGKIGNINSKATFVKGDVRDAPLLQEIMKNVDACFHLAAITSVEMSTKNWSLSHEINIGAAVKIFEVSSKLEKTVPIIYASSAAVYGNNSNLPLKECDFPSPTSAYGTDKFSCELHARIAASIHNVPNIGLRFFNVYGTRQDPTSPYSGVISIFANNALRNLDINVYGDGLQSRDFINVKDVVKFLVLAAKEVDLDAKVVNICSGKPTSINQLIDLIIKKVNKNVNINYLPARIGDIKHSLGDNSFSNKIFSKQASVSLLQGIDELIEHLIVNIQRS